MESENTCVLDCLIIEQFGQLENEFLRVAAKQLQ